MTTVSPKKGHDPARVKAISEKLMDSHELAKLIGELSTSTDDASELVKGLLQASINAGLQAEMDAHLGYEHSDRKAKAQVTDAGGGNHRNGSYTKTVDSGYGPLEVTMPRDRAGTFRPQMVPKGAWRLTELDDMIISLYAGGMTVRDIQRPGCSLPGGSARSWRTAGDTARPRNPRFGQPRVHPLTFPTEV